MKGTLKIKVYKSGMIVKSWKWKAIAPNGKVIASGRGFNSKKLAVKSINTLMSYIMSNAVSIDAK